MLVALITLTTLVSYAEGNRSDKYNASNIESDVIIVHSISQAEGLSLNQARAIFSLRARQWPDGLHISVVVLRDQNPTHINFLKTVLKILPHQLRRHWDRYIYSGIGQGPIVVNSQQEMIDMVNQLPGAIGYMNVGVPHEQVNILTVH